MEPTGMTHEQLAAATKQMGEDDKIIGELKTVNAIFRGEMAHTPDHQRAGMQDIAAAHLTQAYAYVKYGHPPEK